MARFLLSLLLLTIARASGAYQGHWPGKGRANNDGSAACKADVERLCAGVQPGDGRLVRCLENRAAELSEECRRFKFGGRPMPQARRQPPPQFYEAQAARRPEPPPTTRPSEYGGSPQREYRGPAVIREEGLSEDKVEALIDKAVQKAVKEKAVSPDAKSKDIRSDVDKPLYQSSENSDNFALVIGIDKYSDLPRAQFAERDAEAVREHLVALGYPERNIISLVGSKAGKAGLVKNIETWLPRNVGEKSTVFVYYSGHGAPDVKNGQAYLVPWDGDPQFLEDTGYPLKRLYERLGALKAKRVIVALDACFSGGGGRSVLAKGARPLVNKVDTGLAARGKIISLSASSSEEISGTAEKQGHGLFTYYFLKGLNGEARGEDGRVTIKGLYDYLAPKVRDAARRENRDQTPQLMPASLGDQARLQLGGD